MRDTLFDASNNNRLPKCIELVLSEGQGSSQTSLVLIAELRCGADRQAFGSYSATVEVLQAELSLRIDGGSIKPKSRLGEQQRPSVEVTAQKTTTHVVVESEAHVDGTAKVSGPTPNVALGMGAKAKRRATTERKAEDTRETSLYRVRAKGGNAWDISEPGGNIALSGTYLGSDDLCVIESLHGINAVEASLSVQKRHFLLSDIADNKTGSIRKLPVNKQKILQILAANTVSARGDSLILCESILQMKVTST